MRPDQDPSLDSASQSSPPTEDTALEAVREAPEPLFVGSGFPTPNGGDLAGAWEQIQTALRKSIRREQFETWFRRAGLRSFGPEGVHIVVQNGFAADWLRSNYMIALEQATRAVFGQGWPIVIDIDPELSAQARPRSADEPAAPAPTIAPAPNGVHQRAPRESRGGAPESGLLWSSDVALNPRYRFDNFVVGPCNRFAHAAAVGVSEQPGKPTTRSSCTARVGLGKTHLLQSLCFSILERDPQTRILYLSCETFVNHFISALENGDLQKFRNKYRNVDVLVVDDIHLLANKERTQEEFFHTFNTLYNAGKQIVLSSDSPPKDIPTLQDRLVSRFKWGLVTEIEPPCYETRMAILKRKSRERGNELPDERRAARRRAHRGEHPRARGRRDAPARLREPQQPRRDALARHVLRDLFEVAQGPAVDGRRAAR
jgi:chromosomal replication initiator protein